MVPNYGDFSTTETVYIPFNTFSSDDPSASVTITNLAATDIHVHKDGSITQRTSTAGFTVTIDFDGITGNHMLALDLSDNTDAGFWANGSQYSVRMEGTTVDGATINAWIGSFSIGRTLRPTTAGRTLDVTATGAAGIDWGNVENPSTTVDLSATNINLCDTVTTNTDMRGTDNAALASGVTVTTNNDKTGYSLTQTFPTNFADLSITASTGLVDLTQAAADKAWSTAARTLTASTNFNDPTAAAIADAVLDEALAGHVTAGTLGKAITDLDAEDGSSFTAIPWNASWDVEVESEVTDALTAYSAVATTDLPANFSGLTITAGIVSADVKKINAVTVIGAGTSGNLWRA